MVAKILVYVLMLHAHQIHIMHSELPYVNLHHESTSCKLGPSSAMWPNHKTQIKLSNQAVLVKYNSRFCHCIACFSPKLFSETYFSALISCEILHLLKPSCLRVQQSKHKAPPNWKRVYPKSAVSMITERLRCSAVNLFYTKISTPESTNYVGKTCCCIIKPGRESPTRGTVQWPCACRCTRFGGYPP